MATEKNILKIGFPSGLSGVYGWMAQDQLNGVTLAVEETNKTGGVIGREIKIITRDDKSNFELAAKVTRELIQKEKVDLIVGQLSAGTQLAANKETKKAGMIFMSLGQTNELPTAEHLGPYTFHQALTPHMTVQALGNWIFDNLGKKWYIILADYEWGWQTLEAYQAIAKKRKAKIVGIAKIPFPAKEADAFTKYFPDIIKKKPEVLVVANYGLDQLKFMEDEYKASLQRRMSIVNTLSEIPVINKLKPEEAVGMYWGVSFYWALEKTLPLAKKFVSSYRTAFKQIPSAYSAYGYSGALEALWAIKKIGKYPLDAAGMALELEGRTFAHYKTPEWWRPCDHQAFQDYYILKMKGPEERKDEHDTSEIVGMTSWDLDFGRSCESIGHTKNLWGHINNK